MIARTRPVPSRFKTSLLARAGAVILFGAVAVAGEDKTAGQSEFQREVRPLLEKFCFDCHGDGAKKGGVAFDEGTAEALTENHDLWLKALKNVRAGIMPPPQKPQPAAEEKEKIEGWIKSAVFQVDSANPDPGKVTVRRLNRVEYRNTIRDLMGIDFDTEKEFPPDDSGHGFDNISDALTLPPMLLEKYLTAAKAIVSRAVPAVGAVPAEHVVNGKNFVGTTGTVTNRVGAGGNALALSFYEPSTVSHKFNAQHAGKYQLLLDLTAVERFVDNQFDYNKCRLVFKADGKELVSQEFTREGGRAFHFESDQDWKAGEHEFTLEVEPLTPDQKQIRSLTLRIDSVTVRGPLDPKYWARPKNYEKFFGEGPPANEKDQETYRQAVLAKFLNRAYRRPVGLETVERLSALARSVSAQKGKTFEDGMGQAFVATLASPRFLFREEGAANFDTGKFPKVDEYALASRLSYFLWSTMPDEELLKEAEKGTLRKNLRAQQKRMMADWRGEAFVRNFVGQWLQTRDIETVQVDARQILRREAPPDPEADKKRERFRELSAKGENVTAEEKRELDELRPVVFRGFGRGPRADLTGDVRRAMRQETERAVDYVIREDRSLLELLNSDYTFLNERLATHYGLTNLNVIGDEMRLVKLPADSARGGVITHGSVLAVTSNPTRTSPVKRGLFILDNLLGTPPPPPPPDIPPLEDAAKAMKEKTLTLRETLALHREQALCASCHNRMDPLGLALDNFNAMGMWRDAERGQKIDAAGKLMSGESFADVRELKQILVKNHATEFYQTVTEKMLTYALGRGLEYYDVVTVDAIVEELKKSGGKPSVLLNGIVDSAPFQKSRQKIKQEARVTQ